MREKVILICTECLSRNHTTTKKKEGIVYDGKGKHYSASGEAIGGDIEITTLSAWVASGLLKPDEMVTKESGLKQIWNKTTDTFNKVKDGDIVLMHDIYSATANSLEITIPKLLDKGYQFVTVSELFYYKNEELAKGKVYGSAK